MNKGKLITIYGINNIGKSTHARRLVKRLNAEGAKTRYIKYPIYDLAPTGPEINRIIRSETPQSVSEEELQTLFMQNRKDFEPQLLEWIEKGDIIIAEDYSGTGIAWGTAKGLDQEWVERLNGELLKEDYTILMEGKRSLHAKENTHIHETNDDLVEKVDEVLHSLAKKNSWEIVTVQPRIDDTAELMYEKVANFLKNS